MGAVSGAGRRRGDGVRRRLAGLSTSRRRGVVVASVLALYGLLYVLLVLAFASLFGDWPDWTRPLGPMIGGALGSGLVIWRQRRRMGGGERVRQFTRAVRDRRLPDEADPAVWGPLLAGERRALRWTQRIVAPVTALVFAGGASVSAGVLGLGWRVVVAMLLTGMVLIAVGWLAGRRNLARIDGLSDQLRTPTPRE